MDFSFLHSSASFSGCWYSAVFSQNKAGFLCRLCSDRFCVYQDLLASCPNLFLSQLITSMFVHIHRSQIPIISSSGFHLFGLLQVPSFSIGFSDVQICFIHVTSTVFQSILCKRIRTRLIICKNFRACVQLKMFYTFRDQWCETRIAGDTFLWRKHEQININIFKKIHGLKEQQKDEKANVPTVTNRKLDLRIY